MRIKNEGKSEKSMLSSGENSPKFAGLVMIILILVLT